MIKVIWIFLILVLLLGGYSFSTLVKKSPGQSSASRANILKPTKVIPSKSPAISPLAIESMRQKSYPGSPITIEQTLSPGSNFNRFVVSYKSDGLKIYGLLTIPTGKKPSHGWPVILFNHGYIPPASYSTISSYNVMVSPLSTAGYIVFKPDYRGNGNSDGSPTQPYITPDYVTDSMNALASVKKLKEANPQKIGVFGHSMGGNISLHEIVITNDIKAAELMAGVVGNETMLAQWWDHRYSVRSIVGNDLDTYYVFEQMIKDHNSPESDPSYWNSIDPTQFIASITAPVQIQVGSADEDVPTLFSSSLNNLLQKNSKIVDYRVYPGADHNLVPDTASAMATTVAFFNKYLQ
jgi:dipeptidyl aminopeptidase/acylaminoacyl peptidase